MSTEKVKWALEFVRRDLSALDEADWQELREEIRKIVREPGGVERVWGDSRLTHEAITDMQEKARELFAALGLTELFRNKIYRSPTPHGALFWKQPFRSVEGLIFCQEDGKMSVSLDANLTETFLFALAMAFSAVDHTALSLCPSCGKPFLAEHGSQKFCSVLCRNRSSFRTFREKKLKEKAEAQAPQTPRPRAAHKRAVA